MKRSSFPMVVCWAVLMAVCCSCGTGKSLRRAEQCYSLGEYFEAARYYKAAYQRTSPRKRAERGALAFRMAECYRRINYTARAKGAYLNALRYGCKDSVALFYLAATLQKNGEYKAAAERYKAYLDYVAHTSADSLKARGHEALRVESARSGLKACSLAMEWKQQPTRYKVKREQVFLSRRSDYAPMFAADDASLLYFTSTRKEAKGEEENGITGQKSADIFLSRRDERGRWQKPDTLAGTLNTEFEEGACAFSPDGKTMYFTRCRTLPDAPAYAEIYVSQRTGAEWGAPRLFQLTADTLSSYAHPAISADGAWLYFVSDMPGGQGGTDIWRAALTAGGVGFVENLGPEVNTAGSEMFPTVAPDGSLYFSSDGHPGMGGLDIFRAALDSLTGHWQVENLRCPVNSAADDFGMTFEPGHPNRGFFSSNRGDARGWDHLYSFEYPEVHHVLTGLVYDRQGGPLAGATVTLAGNDGTYLRIDTRRDGTFRQEVAPGRSYALLAACRGYLNGCQELATDSVEEDREYHAEFGLASITKPVLIENIFYEFDRADLTPASSASLDELVKLLKDNPTVCIELGAHCDYFGKDDYNLRLSQRRAESVVRYLVAGGIEPDRLTAKGYGEESPKVVDAYALQQAPFLKEGDVLTEEFIKNLLPEEQEICNALNRRTEFRVTRTTYGL